MKRINLDEINLAIESVHILGDTIIIRWSSDIGFGEYVIHQFGKTQKFFAESECIDNNEDKAFGTKLLALWMKQIKVVG